MPVPGENGARVLRRFNSGGETYQPGTLLPPEVVLRWPIRNRIAMANSKQIEFYSPPPGWGPVTEEAIQDAEAVGIKVAGRTETNEEDIDPSFGQFGGVTLTDLSTKGVKYPVGVRLPPALVMSWPLKNRIALQNTGRVAFFKMAPSPEVEAKIAAQDAAAVSNLLG